ncbi:membrane protein GlpM [Bradyrhizobium canariense]|uniref:Membrane protein GlpM n=1 Tax=Bradyrhizobium canariense TaxID=255045 RepID=A0A1H1XYB6_9BRAD|nr:membrane protein GlpM [Bradyrhizobium canariense]
MRNTPPVHFARILVAKPVPNFAEHALMEIIWKGIVGGLMTAAIVWLSKRGNTLPGILPLFPTFALIALLVVGAKNDNAGFREACVAGAKTIPAYLAFLGVCYFTIGRLDYRVALLGGLATWLIVALAIFLALRSA